MEEWEMRLLDPDFEGDLHSRTFCPSCDEVEFKSDLCDICGKCYFCCSCTQEDDEFNDDEVNQ